MEEENTYITRLRDTKYLVITHNNATIEMVEATFKDVKSYDILNKNGEVVNKMMTFNATLSDAVRIPR